MSLQTELSPDHATRKSNIVNVPASELLRMVGDLRHAVEGNPENASEIALQFLRRIVLFDSVDSGVARGGLAPWQKRKVDRYLRDKLEHSIGLNELASEARLSVSHFCRAFKKSFGDTPHRMCCGCGWKWHRSSC